MNLKKIIASVAASAVAISMMAVNAFAATIELNSEYTGGWSASKSIPKSEFDAIGGDVKVVITYETLEPLIGTHNHLAKPMNIDVSWDEVTSRLTSNDVIAKNDGFIVFPDGSGTYEFVVPADLIAEMGDNGLAFQVNDVIIKSAELSAGSAEGEIRRVAEDQSEAIMDGKSYEEATGAAAPADDAADTTADAPAAETTTTTTTAPATGNVPAAVMLSVMAVAGVAAVATKKRK